MTKCSPGSMREAVDLLAAEKEGIAGLGQPDDLQPRAVPEQSGVAARDVLIPGTAQAPPSRPRRHFLPSGSLAASVVELQFLGQSDRAWDRGLRFTV